MTIQKLITFITFITLTTTNSELVTKYNIIITKAMQLPENLNKTSILTYLSNLYKDINLYLSENNNLLSRKEKKYIKALKNLIMQLRRYLTIQNSTEFPQIFTNLDEKEFKFGIEELSREKKISKEITLLSKPFVYDFKVLQPKRKGINPFKK